MKIPDLIKWHFGVELNCTTVQMSDSHSPQNSLADSDPILDTSYGGKPPATWQPYWIQLQLFK